MSKDIKSFFKKSDRNRDRNQDGDSNLDSDRNPESDLNQDNDRNRDDRNREDDRNRDDQNSRSRPTNKYSSMPLDEKRKLYRCGSSYVILDEIPLWPVLQKVNEVRIKRLIERKREERTNRDFRFKEDRDIPTHPLEVMHELNMKISLWQGDITKLEIDAIVNAANESCLGGGGVDGSIHRAAGSTLKEECRKLNGCRTGEAKLTSGHKLPAKYVIHTVGPRGKNPEKLKNCYENSLQIALENDFRSIAFCCISTGVFGYPNRDAAHVALLAARKWLEKHGQKMDRIIFCTYLSEDFEIYQELMADKYFPCTPDENKDELESRQKVPVEDSESVRLTKTPSESDDSVLKVDIPPEGDRLPSLELSPDNIKRVVEAEESVFEYEEDHSATNYAVDLPADDSENAGDSQNPMDLGSQQIDPDDMDLGSQQM